MKKFNAIVHIIHPCTDEGDYVNISIVTPDQQEHEIMIRKEDFVLNKYWIPVEYFVHPSCCEHENGCPGGSSTQKFLEKINKENAKN